MKKVLVCALALGGFAASAQAADLSLESLKDAIPEIKAAGVTFYGTIDVGYAYQTNGAPFSGALYTGLDYNMFGSAQNRQPISSLTNSALSQSTVGVKVEEALGYGFTGIAKLETGFNPLSGEIADACASLTRNNGRPTQYQDSGGDGSRCGQFLNGPAYAGVSNPLYGTLTIGRQNTLDLDVLAKYDPMGLSYAFSLIGWSGTAGPGAGTTETARWDESIKYVWQYGPFHAGAMYANGSPDSSIQNHAAAGNVGVTWRGFSVDAVYTEQLGAVSASSLTPAQAAGWLPGSLSKTLNGTILDEATWTVAGKYTFDLGGGGFKDGWSACGLKDECAGGKLTFFGGYQHVDASNPSDPVTYTNPTTIGGYNLININNTPFYTDRVRETAWAGAKYEIGPWSFAGAWYTLHQDFYKKTAASVSCSDRSATNCSGDTNTASFLVDYTVNKNFDIYAGVAWSEVSGGLAAPYTAAALGTGTAFLQTENTTFATGMRLKF